VRLSEKIFAVFDRHRTSGGEFPWGSIREWESEAFHLERLLQEFVEYQIGDYDRVQKMARAYCDLRHRARKVLGESSAPSEPDEHAK
jgi:hypothetical protein